MYRYTGKEPSPKGLGKSARHYTIGKVLKGRKGNLWIVAVDKNERKYWKRHQSNKNKKKSFLAESINTEEEFRAFLIEKRAIIIRVMGRLLDKLGLGPQDAFDSQTGCTVLNLLMTLLGKKFGQFLTPDRACFIFVELFHPL
jgi:hypothetical protein